MLEVGEVPSGGIANAPPGDRPEEGEGSLRESPMTYSPGAQRRLQATSATERSHKDGHRPCVKESTKMLREHKDAPKPVGEGSPRESPVVFKLGLRTESSSGQPLAIPGSQLREGTMRYCSCCWAPDHSTLIWCKQCNKHLHRRCFTNPAEAESVFLLHGWTCDECER